MAGLLDIFSDPRSAGLLGMASGLLNAAGPSRMPVSLGQGLAQGYLSGAQMSQGVAQSNLARSIQEEQLKQLQTTNARSAALAPILAGIASRFTAQPTTAPTGLSDASAAAVGAPWAAASQIPQQQQPMPARSGFPLSLEDVTALKLAGGPDLTSAYTAGRPNINVEGGYIVDRNRGILGAVPQTNQQGFSTMTVPDPSAPGGYRVIQVPGGAEAFGTQQDIAERTRAQYDLVPVPVAGGGTQLLPRSVAAARLGGGAGAVPSAPTGPAQIPQRAQPAAPGGLGRAPSEAQRTFETELGKRQAADLVEGHKAAQEAVEIIGTVNEGRKLLDAGIVTGAGADYIVSFGQALAQMGFDVGGDATSNSQAFAANMAQNVGRIIKQFGAGSGLSDADRQYAAKMAGGEITLDERALRRILDINERAARNVIKLQNRKAAGIKSRFPLTVEEPAPYKPAKPPANYTAEDLEFTARKYGLTVDEVRRRLGEAR